MDPSKSKDFLSFLKTSFEKNGSLDFAEKYGKEFINKFIFWVVKNYFKEKEDKYDLDIDKMYRENSNITGLLSLVATLEKYADNVERGLIPKEQGDIYKLKSFVDVKKLNDAAEEVITKSKEKEMAKAGAEVVLDGENFFLVRPMTEEASCLFGRNTRWCISATKSRNYFNQYVGEGKAFYFLRNENLPNDHIYKKIAFVVDNDSMESMEPYEIYDAEDNSIDMDEVISAIQENIFGERYDEIINGGSEPTKKDIEKFTKLGMKGLDKVTKVNLEDEIMEQGNELAYEYLNEINDEMYSHLSDNPASLGMEERAEEIQEKADKELKHLSVYHDFDNYGDGNRIYFGGNVSFDFSDLDWEWDDLEDKIETIVSEEFGYGYNDDIEIEGNSEDGYSVRIGLQADYDEAPDAEGFESFVNRMYDIDNDYDDYRERMVKEFSDQAFIKSEAADFLASVQAKVEDSTEHFETDISKGAVQAKYTLEIDYEKLRDDVIESRKNSGMWKVGGSQSSANHVFSYNIKIAMLEARDPWKAIVTKLVKEKITQLVDDKQLSLPGIPPERKQQIKNAHELISNLTIGTPKFKEYKAKLQAEIGYSIPFKMLGSNYQKEKGADKFGPGYADAAISLAKSIDNLYPILMKELAKSTRPYFENAIKMTDKMEKDRAERETPLSNEVTFESKRKSKKLKIRILKS